MRNNPCFLSYNQAEQREKRENPTSHNSPNVERANITTSERPSNFIGERKAWRNPPIQTHPNYPHHTQSQVPWHCHRPKFLFPKTTKIKTTKGSSFSLLSALSKEEIIKRPRLWENWHCNYFLLKFCIKNPTSGAESSSRVLQQIRKQVTITPL